MSKYGTRYGKDGKTPRVIYPQEYNTWASMRNRCLNPNHTFYNLYGGKGIKICERWRGRDGFTNFLEDMGPKPSHKLTKGGRSSYSLDRINPDGDYCPENCKWSSWYEQQANKKTRREHVGIYQVPSGHWRACFKHYGKSISKVFISKQDAINQRIKWEKENPLD